MLLPPKMCLKMFQVSTFLFLILISLVHASSISTEKKRDLLINEEDDPESRNIVLPYLSVECFFEPLKMKQRCKSQTSGAQLKRLGTGIYSFQTAQKVNWYAARDWCRARGMDLVTVDSAAEDQLIVNYLYNYYVTNGIPKSDDAFFWTGLNDLAVDRSFTWVATGQPLGGYTNWSPGQPAQPVDVPEHCGEYMYRDAPKPAWNDRGCTDWTGPFICEVNAPCKCYAGI